jgi:ABC-type phosphate transport system permease subunit
MGTVVLVTAIVVVTMVFGTRLGLWLAEHAETETPVVTRIFYIVVCWLTGGFLVSLTMANHWSLHWPH